MEGIRLNHEVGSAQMCRKKSTEEGRMQGSHDGNMKGGRAKLRPSISRHFSPHHAVTTYPTSPDLDPIVTHRLSLTACRSLPEPALLSRVSVIEEPVGCAVGQTITDGRRRKGSDRPRPSRRAGHRCAERSIES